MRRMRERRADISPHDSASRLLSAGIDVYFGEARFTSPSTMEVDGRQLTFRRAVIATGGRAAVPPIPGLSSVPFLTNETLFSLADLPRRLGIVGAGPIGCEMAQAFARLGSIVTLVDQASRVLPSEDADAAAIVAARMAEDGVAIETGASVAAVRQGVDGIVIRIERGGAHREFTCDQLLVAVGRTPNVEGLGLAAAGVAAGKDGVSVNDRLRTSNPRIFAAGDVCSPFKFTHAADAAARIVIQNALFFGRARASALVIPWCTYTDPEVAHVGWQADAARRHGHHVETMTIALGDVDRAVVDEERDGFVRIHHARGRLLGCTVVSSRAGEMIGLAAFALKHGMRLGDLGSVIYPYPTLTNAFRAAGDVFGRSRLTPRVRALLRWYFSRT
jgi:pyruvate/2-oxoglutarate dehydrogenase complex dihydrolipoamide dehydrogenase (E3) component